MPILRLFSRRQKEQRREFPDVYQYKELPNTFRVQAVHIFVDLFGVQDDFGQRRHERFKAIHDALCREYGLFRLTDERAHQTDPQASVINFFLGTPDTERALDVIELVMRVGHDAHGNDHLMLRHSRPTITPRQAEEELNARFKEHGIGFQYSSEEIIRIDSELLHEEAVKPALQVLTNKKFAAANGEFLKAHEHYRHGQQADTVSECLKALESTLKVLCKTKKWTFAETDTAKRLLDIVFEKGLIPKHLESAFSGLRAVLENAVPTTRNRLSGHGAGSEPKQIPAHLAAYVLHVTASSILFLTEAEKQL